MADEEADGRARSIDEAISSVLTKVGGISELKHEQRDALKAFVVGEDVLALLPTGFGKSLIYQLVPGVWKKLSETSTEWRGVDKPIVYAPTLCPKRPAFHTAAYLLTP
uniref:DEAD/DEAH box helicase domain-containing protein n=1 Tax=Branchiostoma floridae TaxID=7739 RepID=C3Z6I4_BRAFL|eukprot:XP_002595816.1 hypothetical protein BRAFLDRAFT_96790 [Branchiostoma floridae]